MWSVLLDEHDSNYCQYPVAFAVKDYVVIVENNGRQEEASPSAWKQ
jgi:hypothetical protein